MDGFVLMLELRDVQRVWILIQGLVVSVENSRERTCCS